MNDEVRITSETGGQKGAKPARFGGIDPLAAMELAKVYGYGEMQKYERYNYLKGYDWSLSVDALFRHLFAFLSGEDFDPETGFRHTAHVAWHALTLTSFQLRGIGKDDRAPRLEKDPVLTIDEIHRWESLEALKQVLGQLNFTHEGECSCIGPCHP